MNEYQIERLYVAGWQPSRRFGLWTEREPAERVFLEERAKLKDPTTLRLTERTISEWHVVVVEGINCPGPHTLVQHRDARPPWCPRCGRDAEGRVQKEIQ